MRATAFVLLMIGGSAQLKAQERAVVQGRVVEAGTRSGIAAANLTITGTQTISGRSGEFRLPPLRRGPATLRVTALGYLTRDIDLNVQSDTAILIELEPRPLRVDSLIVSGRTVTLRGKVLAQQTREPVSDAQITVGDRTTTTNLIGNFKVSKLPIAEPISVHIGAVTYQPAEFTFTSERDTAVQVELAPDPVGQALLNAAVKKIEVRSRSLPYRRDQWDRDYLRKFPRSLEQLFLERFGRRLVPSCLFLDDKPLSLPAALGQDSTSAMILRDFYTDEMERVEVFNKGTMVRLYTRRFAVRQSASVKMPPIVLVMTPRGPMCQ